MLGDFNEILLWAKKWSGHDQSEHQIESFRSMLANCGLSDLSFLVIPFHGVTIGRGTTEY